MTLRRVVQVRNWLQPRLLARLDRAAFDRAAKYDQYATNMQMLGCDPDEGLRIALLWAQVGAIKPARREHGL